MRRRSTERATASIDRALLRKIFGMLSSRRGACKRIDFSRSMLEGASVALREERVAAPADSGHLGVAAFTHRRRWPPAAAVALALTAGALLAVRCDRPPFFDNEGRFAEVAREMVESGDWITPRLDGTLFLNKPPLTYWLAGLVFRVTGPSEWARLVPVLAAVVTLFATCRLGALLYGARVGLLAGVVLATSVGFA